MNILIYTIASPYGSGRVGGAETSLRLLAEKLAERGHQVYFFCREDKKSLKAYTRKTIKGVEVFTLTRILLPVDTYKTRKLAEKIHHNLLMKILRKQNIQVVHTYYNLSLCKKLLKYRAKTNFKFIIRVAGMRWAEEIKKKPEIKKEYLNVFSAADSLNFISEGLRTLFFNEWNKIGNLPSIQHQKVLDIGVDLNRLPSIQKQEQKEGVFRMAMISRLSKYQKRQDILIEAMSRIDPRLPIHLTLVGTGDNEDVLQSLINKLGLTSRVEIVPFIAQEKLWEYMSELDLLVHACDYEGLSKIIIESMGMGLPVLASDVLPLSSYIVHGENGFLSANTAQEWTVRIQDIYNKKNMLYRVSKISNLFINDQYNANKNIESYDSYFSLTYTFELDKVVDR